MSSELQWKTKDGRVYPVSLMTDEHLYNAYKHVRDLPVPGDLTLAAELFRRGGRMEKREAFDKVIAATNRFFAAKQNTLDAFQAEATRRGLGELF